MTAAATTPPREIFPEVDIPARLIINTIEVRAESPLIITAASAAGNSTAARAPDDYYRRERLQPTSNPTDGEDAMNDKTAAHGSHDDKMGWIGKAVIVIVLAFAVLVLINAVMNRFENKPLFTGYTSDSPPWRQSSGPNLRNPGGGGNARPRTGQDYCDSTGRGGTFMYWKGSGASRMAHCE